MATMKTLLLILCLVASSAMAATHATDGSIEQVRATNALASVVSGDTITIPAGLFYWTTNLTLTKGVHLRGAGSGRIVGRSRTSMALGTGTKVFTLTTNAYRTNMYVPDGTMLRIWKLQNYSFGASNMTGTVTSIVGDQLTMNILGAGGAGTAQNWLIATEPQTIVISNFGLWGQNTLSLIEINGATDGSVEVSGINFIGSTDGQYFTLTQVTGGRQVKIHDCWFNQTYPASAMIHNNGAMCVIYDCSVSYGFVAVSSHQFYQSQLNGRAESWASVSTMGTNDVGGTNNSYIESCDFHGNTSAGMDFDNNTRIVLRHNLFNHFAVNSHGNDTSVFGVRHVEYGPFNVFEYQNGGDNDGSISVDQALYILLRGGTGIIVSNTFENITSVAWADKPEVVFGIWGLGRWGAVIGGYSSDDGCVPEWPMGRQFGYGWINGTGMDGQGNTHVEPDGYGDIAVGEPEPLYYWGNSGTIGIAIQTDGIACVQNNDPGYGGHTPDNPADYIKAGREFTNIVKTAWASYTFPHPMRTAASAGAGVPTTLVNVHGTIRVGTIVVP